VDLRWRRAPHELQPGVRTEHLEDYARMAGIEFLVIDNDTRVREFQNELRWNDTAYRLREC